MASLEFFFDCSSPWTYLAFHNVQRLVGEAVPSVRWRPILVGGIFNHVNPSVYDARARPVPAKQAYATKSLLDWARWSGLTLTAAPRIFPVNSVKVMRACLVLDDQAKLVPFARAAFEAYWRDDRDISDDGVIRELCWQVDVNPDSVFDAIRQQSTKDALRANTEELVARGGFGSPTVFVNGTDMYFGNDHLPLVQAALDRLAADPARSASCSDPMTNRHR